MGQDKAKDRYRDTLNLPETPFAMRANLVENEPKMQARWSAMGLSERIRKSAHPAGSFVFHDGPPYANGPIHLGHLLNKVLKDVVVRARTMAGYAVDFVPGWDCHGLPIEHKVMKELGAKAREMSSLDIRARCEAYAKKYVELQGGQMRRLGTMARYDDPYLTMNPRYEAAVLEVFARLVQEGAVYRALKPVHWSIANRTALAEAELEYEQRTDTSVYVLFELQGSLPPALQRSNPRLMVWTTTPWTLPANLAVAVGPNITYGVYAFTHEGEIYHAVLAETLAGKVFARPNLAFEQVGTISGQALVDAQLTYRHPFINRPGVVVGAEYVTDEDGTGLVHTAPGHGNEDYQTGLKAGLNIYCPVRADGTYDDTVPEWLRGMDVWKANEAIVQHLRESGHLFFDHKFAHSYPHDWRSKTPTIFRATEQWFIGVDAPLRSGGKSLRDMAVHAAREQVRFVPEWGQSRLLGMLEARPDWCISRQRAWGLPIPAFIDRQGRSLLTPATVQAVARAFREHGSNYWFTATPAQLLAGYDAKADPDRPEWFSGDIDVLEKGQDIFDVWFESGSSWHAVLRERDLGYPADLYLEGSDQHRGWFQLSLLPALGATGQPPFKTVLTHGFMVDARGRKMSKSLGNTVEVEDLLKKYGADICRWWVASLNATHDIKVDWELFKVASEEYRKVRNTVRFMLSNLSDFDVAQHRYTFGDADRHSLDTWVLAQLDALVATVNEAYETLQLRRIREALFNFCNDTSSAVYLAAVKDRLYCEAKDSPKRRRTQTALHEICDALLRMMAPILAHTADEAYLVLRGEDAQDTSVHLERLPQSKGRTVAAGWEDVLELRHEAQKAFEGAKAALGVTNPMDVGGVAILDEATYAAVAPHEAELADLCGFSTFRLERGSAREIKLVDLRAQPRCERSWRRDGTVAARRDGGMLSERDARVLGLA